MEILLIIAQIVVSLAIFNVWLLRFEKPTQWRAGDARNMKEEFEAYGLPLWFMRVVNVSKLLLAGLLLAGIWMSEITRPAAIGMVVLMAGAVFMHFKVRDPLKKSLPASVLMILSLSLVIFN